MGVYWNKQDVVGSIQISTIRSTTDLHYTENPQTLTAETLYRTADQNLQGAELLGIWGMWSEPVWVGRAEIAHDVHKWVVESLKAGASIDEIEDYVMDNQAKFS
jgi:hypothetical protein